MQNEFLLGPLKWDLSIFAYVQPNILTSMINYGKLIYFNVTSIETCHAFKYI